MLQVSFSEAFPPQETTIVSFPEKSQVCHFPSSVDVERSFIEVSIFGCVVFTGLLTSRNPT